MSLNKYLEIMFSCVYIHLIMCTAVTILVVWVRVCLIAISDMKNNMTVGYVPDFVTALLDVVKEIILKCLRSRKITVLPDAFLLQG